MAQSQRQGRIPVRTSEACRGELLLEFDVRDPRPTKLWIRSRMRVDRRQGMVCSRIDGRQRSPPRKQRFVRLRKIIYPLIQAPTSRRITPPISSPQMATTQEKKDNRIFSLYYAF